MLKLKPREADYVQWTLRMLKLKMDKVKLTIELLKLKNVDQSRLYQVNIGDVKSKAQRGRLCSVNNRDAKIKGKLGEVNNRGA